MSCRMASYDYMSRQQFSTPIDFKDYISEIEKFRTNWYQYNRSMTSWVIILEGGMDNGDGAHGNTQK